MKKKILIICTKYPLENNSTWLTRELAEEFSYRGDDINVLCIDWNSKYPEGVTTLNNVKVNVVPAISAKKGIFGFAIKWFFSSILAVFKNKKVFRKKYDLVIGFSPCVSSWFAIIIAKILCKKSLLIYWDFFPIHQMQIGMIGKGLKSKLLKLFENYLVNRFNYVGCMSELNSLFFKDYFVNSKAHVFELPIWSEDLKTKPFFCQDNPLAHKLSKEDILFIFGGQIDFGRGIENILESARIAHKHNEKIKVIIIGEGRLSYKVSEVEKSVDSGIIYSGFIPRDEYINLISICLAGIVATVPNVTVPTYPSKSLDYMKAGLPIIASVEDSTDFGNIIESNGAGVCCEAGDALSLANLMLKLANDPDAVKLMGQKANELFKNRHEIKKVVDGLNKNIYEDDNV